VRQNSGLQGDYVSNLIDLTPGNVLIAGLGRRAPHGGDTGDGVQIEGITPGRLHGRFATVRSGSRGSQYRLWGTEIKVVQAQGLPPGTRPQPAFTCDGMFVPME